MDRDTQDFFITKEKNIDSGPHLVAYMHIRVGLLADIM